jgi:hypothetical protein
MRGAQLPLGVLRSSWLVVWSCVALGSPCGLLLGFVFALVCSCSSIGLGDHFVEILGRFAAFVALRPAHCFERFSKALVNVMTGSMVGGVPGVRGLEHVGWISMLLTYRVSRIKRSLKSNICARASWNMCCAYLAPMLLAYVWRCSTQGVEGVLIYLERKRCVLVATGDLCAGRREG